MRKRKRLKLKLLQPFSLLQIVKNRFLIVDAQRAEHSAKSVVVAGGFVLRRDRNDVKQTAVAKLRRVNGRYLGAVGKRRAPRQNRGVTSSAREIDARVI